jgi:fatty acid desaturase
VVFVGFGIFQQTRKFVAQGDQHDLNTVLLFFFLFVTGMLLAAALPTLALEYPGDNTWIKAGGILSGAAYLLYGMLMLWLTLAAYESYRHADEGE